MENDAMNDGSDQAAEPASEASIKILLRRAGWKEAKAFFEPGHRQAETSESDTKSRTDSQRKAAQRKRQLEEGLRQVNVMAPDEEDGRGGCAENAADQVRALLKL
jgi:cellobiose phosphorylase